MEIKKIIVSPSSENFWWGVYGFSPKVGWEDLNLFYENGQRIGRICLNTKDYLGVVLSDLIDDQEEKKYITAIQQYLIDDKCHFWYFYDKKGSDDFYEVPYKAPKNNEGVKPRLMEIWHPDNRIAISTIENGIRVWAKKHLGMENCQVIIENDESIENSLISFKKYERHFNSETKTQIQFSDELIEELSEYWDKSTDEVIKKLEITLDQK